MSKLENNENSETLNTNDLANQVEDDEKELEEQFQAEIAHARGNDGCQLFLSVKDAKAPDIYYLGAFFMHSFQKSYSMHLCKK